MLTPIVLGALFSALLGLWFYSRDRAKLRMTDLEIIAALDPWTLCCAVGAVNGTTGSRMGFETWLRLSRDNWWPRLGDEVRAAGRGRVEDLLRSYAHANGHHGYEVIFEKEKAKRADFARANGLLYGGIVRKEDDEART